MKLQEKTEKSSSISANVLPLGNKLPDAVASKTADSTTSDGGKEDHSTDSRSSELNLPQIDFGGQIQPKHFSFEAPEESEPLAPAQIEQIVQRINEQIPVLTRLGSESVDVSLRPDQSTVLNLHLSLNNGQVEIDAKLQGGDSRWLDANWSGLQQTLAQQGIRLGQLEHASTDQNFTGNQSSNPFAQSGDSNSEGQPRYPHPHPGELAESSAVVVPSTKSWRPQTPRAEASSQQRWEVWA